MTGGPPSAPQQQPAPPPPPPAPAHPPQAPTSRPTATRAVLDAPALDVRSVLRKAAAPSRALSRAGALFQPLLPHAEGGPTTPGRATPGAPTSSDPGSRAAAWAASIGGGGGSLGTWLKVDPDGRAEPVLVNRRPLMSELGLAPRDLRLLDPQLAASYPSAILARGRALLVRLEHVRAIVTRSWTLVQEWEAPAAATFVRALQAQLGREGGDEDGEGGWGGDAAAARRRSGGFARKGLARAGMGVVRAAAALTRKSMGAPAEVGGEGAGAAPGVAPDPPVAARGPASPAPSPWLPPAGSAPAGGPAPPPPPPTPAAPSPPPLQGGEPGLWRLTPARGGTALGVASPASAAALPFELRVVEVALDSVARHFAVAAHAVEAAAGPCLRMPTATKLTTDFLQRLRAVKQRAAVTRIKLETVREVLERLLDDRQAMVSLHLTAVEAAEAVREAAAAEAGGGGGGSEGGVRSPWAGLSAAAARLVRRSGGPLFSRLVGPGAFGRRSLGVACGGGAGRHSFVGASPAAALAAALERASTGSAAAGHDAGPSSAAATAAAISIAASLAAALDRRSLSGSAPAKALASYLARASAGSDASGDGGGRGGGTGAGGGPGGDASTPGADPPRDPPEELAGPEEPVEMLLETYLAALDAAHARLEALDEHVEGVEDLIDIELDAFRNNSIKARLVVNACGLVAFVVFAITGFLAMNLAQAWRAAEEVVGQGGEPVKVWPKGSALMFGLVGAGSAGGALLGLMAWLAYLNRRGLGLASITTLTRAGDE